MRGKLQSDQEGKRLGFRGLLAPDWFTTQWKVPINGVLCPIILNCLVKSKLKDQCRPGWLCKDTCSIVRLPLQPLLFFPYVHDFLISSDFQENKTIHIHSVHSRLSCAYTCTADRDIRNTPSPW